MKNFTKVFLTFAVMLLLIVNVGLGQISANDIMITHYSPRYSAAGDEYLVLFNNTDNLGFDFF